MGLLNYLKKLSFMDNSRPVQYPIQTFTFYIPSPPMRKSGYREKEFDKTFYEFINKGYEIISVNTESNSSPNHSGMWVIYTVRALNDESAKLVISSTETIATEIEIDNEDNQPLDEIYYTD